MTEAINFGAGPAMLPTAVLQTIQQEILNYQQSGLSILEINHRSVLFQTIFTELNVLLRELLDIPSDYVILWLGAPARLQFSMIPLNFLDDVSRGAYVVSGIWSKLALEEAAKLKQAYVLASSEENQFNQVPHIDNKCIKPHTAYLYLTPNETINGNRLTQIPQVDLPIIADMTSCLLTEPLKVSQFDFIFAGVQKNIANAGLTLVLARHSFLKKSVYNMLPTYLSYQTHEQAHSLYGTPPTFNCYVALKMLQWLKAQGGVVAVYQHNQIKAQLLYDYIDASNFYYCKVLPKYRSQVNVCFGLPSHELEQTFVIMAEKKGLYGLKGHRFVGGIRASIYNAMPLSSVKKLLDFMQTFAQLKGHKQ